MRGPGPARASSFRKISSPESPDDAGNGRPAVKLIIQIPCLNEEATLPTTLAALPRSFEGIGAVEVLLINDGSTDRTVEVARNLKVEHILSFKTNQGLAKVFTAGFREAARLGADYVVNLDADNQYDARDIPQLLAPLREGVADIVVGERPIQDIPHFLFLRKSCSNWARGSSGASPSPMSAIAPAASVLSAVGRCYGCLQQRCYTGGLRYDALSGVSR